MKRIKSVVLAMMMVVVLALPVMAGELSENTKQSNSSKIESASVKAPKTAKAKAVSSSQIKIGWSKVAGADYYLVYSCDEKDGVFTLLVNSDGANDFAWAGNYSASVYDVPPSTTMYFMVATVKDGYMSPYSKVVKATTLKPSKSEQITAMRAQEVIAPPGSTLAINARINNLIIELQIHKLRYESNTTFKRIVQGMTVQGSNLTLKAKQYNNISTQVMNGSMKDDEAIVQLQALSLVK